ncbi:hypothetical protein F7U66_01905 [Vibrio parahaemolyticus]|nr:hypothetical protein [Vibrio parahaemolyticus]
MKTIKVVISKEAKDAISDFELVDWYSNILLAEEEELEVKVATYLMFCQLRAGVRLKQIAPFNFEYEGKEYQVAEKDAKVYPEWPTGFFDQQASLMFTVMTGKLPE